MTREEIIEAIFSNMQSVHRLSATKLHTLMGQHDISRSQMELLLAVKHKQPIATKELASQLHMTPGAITQLTEALVSSGYLERKENSSDRRITDISLSADGKKKLTQIWHHRTEVIKRVMHTLDTSELEVMLRIQQKMAQQIEIESANQDKKEQ